MEINQPAAKFQDMSIAPMYTVEHILNQTMVRMFECERSRNAYIERKKSKCDYTLPCAPSDEQIAAIGHAQCRRRLHRVGVAYEVTAIGVNYFACKMIEAITE